MVRKMSASSNSPPLFSALFQNDNPQTVISFLTQVLLESEIVSPFWCVLDTKNRFPTSDSDCTLQIFQVQNLDTPTENLT